MSEFSFKSYCWVIGTTSFRVKDLNYKIEMQLQLFKELWKNHPSENWKELQVTYYKMLSDSGLVIGTASRPDKDARQVSSGLVDMGLLTKERKITEVGNKILDLSLTGNFSPNNIFNIAEDSYTYLLQFLKYYIKTEDFDIKPFVALIYLLTNCDYLTIDEITYLLPVCTNAEKTIFVAEKINEIRNDDISIDDILLSLIWSMNNYINAFEYFVNKDFLCEEDFGLIGMNRKSPLYDYSYKAVFDSIKSIREELTLNESTSTNLLIKYSNLLDSINTLKQKTYWNNIFTGNNTVLEMTTNIEIVSEFIYNLTIFTVNEVDFRKEFFELMHLYKWKATLVDYQDLNRRYFSLADILIYEADKVTLDFFPKYYFKDIAEELLLENIPQEEIDKYYKYISLEKISDKLSLDVSGVINKLESEEGISLNIETLYNYVATEKQRRLNELISTKFTRNKLHELLAKVESRKDNEIYNEVTKDASIPTIFEYIVALAWYHISDYKVDVLDSINAKLDSNLLPKCHAAGGQADLVFKYKNNSYYPEHNLLLEVTLTDSTNQRRAEMEPVSRHLGEYLIKNPNDNNYAIFIAPYINDQVAIDFRMKKITPYTSGNGSYLNGMKIIPLSTEILKRFLLEKMLYDNLYSDLNKIYESTLPTHEWYKKEIVEKYN